MALSISGTGLRSAIVGLIFFFYDYISFIVLRKTFIINLGALAYNV